MLVLDRFKLLLLIQEWLALNCRVSWENGPQGPCELSISGWAQEGRAGSSFHLKCLEGLLDPARPVPGHPPFQRKLRLAGCLGEMTQWGSLAESCLLGPRSPVPQLPASGGLRSLRDWVAACPWALLDTICLGPMIWTTSVSWSVLWGSH